MTQRKTKKGNQPAQYKKSTTKLNSTDSQQPIWDFSNIDNDGVFAFKLDREDMDSAFLLDKLLQYSKMTWRDIKSATHDKKGKSKNHVLDYKGISKAGKERIDAKHIEPEDYDIIFSFALENRERLIGLKRNRVFQIIWYDSQHEFYPSKKKHT